MKRILVVDDQEDIRELVRMTLELDGYEVHEAHNGDEGLRAVSRVQPDLMLLDVMMPGNLDGLGVCRALRSAPPSKKLKVVMLSAKGQKADQKAGMDAGADAYLAKPFSPRELLQLVSRMA